MQKMETFIFPENEMQKFSAAVFSVLPFSDADRIMDTELLICIPADSFPYRSISVTNETCCGISQYSYQEESGISYFCTIRSMLAFLRECCLKLMEKVRIAVKRILCSVPGGDIQIANCQFAL